MTTRLHPSFRSALVAALALAALAGCNQRGALIDPLTLDPKSGYTPANFRGDARLPNDLHRVAVLPIHGGELAPVESLAALERALVGALQKHQRFEVVILPREECRRLFGATDFSSVSALPHGFLEQIAARYAVEAVLFTDLTVYRPYQPMSLGLRAKLVGIREVRMVWAYDEIFSAEDPRLRRTIASRQRSAVRGALVDPTPAVLQSPAQFGAVAAEIMFGTLPPR